MPIKHQHLFQFSLQLNHYLDTQQQDEAENTYKMTKQSESDAMNGATHRKTILELEESWNSGRLLESDSKLINYKYEKKPTSTESRGILLGKIW